MQVRRKRRPAIDGSEPSTVDARRSLWDRYFGVFACGIILISVSTRAFDYSLVPLSYKGVFIARPYCGLRSDAIAGTAWAARSHVKYGLSYTRGYRTLALGGPPAAQPLRDIGHLPAETWITALGMKLFGTHDWSLPSLDAILSIPALSLMMFLLRRLYGSGCALLSGLLVALFPLSGYFGFQPLLVLLVLWALWRYLLLIGRFGDESGGKLRHAVELAVALFLLIQLSWVGVFYALAIGLHYLVVGLVRRRIRWGVLALLALSAMVSTAINLHVMAAGCRHNVQVQAATHGPAQLVFDRMGVLPPKIVKVNEEPKDSVWDICESLWQWETGEGKKGSFAWNAWLSRNLRHAGENFTPSALVFLIVYLVYFVLAHIVVLGRRIVAPKASDGQGIGPIPRSFLHMWFFLLPGLLFLLVFRGLIRDQQYWQAPLALFVAIGTALGLLWIGDVFGGIHRVFGGSVVAALTVILVVLCNEGLSDYRDVRWQSPRTLDLFKELNRRTPPDRGLLTFTDFTVREPRWKLSYPRPEYAWYLDREMVPANAWVYEMFWTRSARIDEAVDKTIREVQRQAKTGRFAYYMVPAREKPDYDPLYGESQVEHFEVVLQRVGLGTSSDSQEKLEEAKEQARQASMAALTPEELEKRFNDDEWGDDTILAWEKHRRYREAVITRLKDLYRHEYYDNPAVRGDEDFDSQANTPCLLFDLMHPKK